MIFVFLLSGFLSKKPTLANFGVIDVIDENVCLVQKSNEDMVAINVEFCDGLREGDIIKIVRKIK